MLADEIAEAGVLLAETVVGVKAVVALPLTGQIGDQVGASGGDADGVVKVDAVVQTAVQHGTAVHAPEPAAGVCYSDFHDFTLFQIK